MLERLLYGKQHKKGYIIHENPNKFTVCKILNEYGSSEEAKNDLISLVTKVKCEKDLLREFQGKQSW